MNVEQLNILGMIRHLGEDVLPKDAKLVLFGSQARGDARQDSDWDLLILLDGERISNEDFDAMAFPFVELGWTLGVEINTLIYTYLEWKRREISPFYKNVMKEGIALC